MNAEVILYGDRVTDSMERAIGETNRRRVVQLAYNELHGITPVSVKSAILGSIEDEVAAQKFVQEAAGVAEQDYITAEFLEELQKEMLEAAAGMEFERAAELRDKIARLKGEKVAAPQAKKTRGGKSRRGRPNGEKQPDGQPKRQRTPRPRVDGV